MNKPAVEDPRASARLDATAWLAILAPVVCLLPFVNKAFHIDDPVYLWVAQHIQQHPLDFYGFTKNWSFFEEPMFAINQNPPGVSYVLAVAAFVVGWSEVALHAVFLIPVFGLSLGVYRLAQRFTSRPVVATLVTMLAPVTLVSSSNVMSDTLTLALGTWAVLFWIRATSSEERRAVGGSGEIPAFAGMTGTVTAMCLLAFAILTKYLAVCFVPLLIVYAVVQRANVRTWLPALIPLVVIMGTYLFWSHHLYGINPLARAASFASNFDELERALPPGARFTTGLAFAGGCYIAALFVLPVLWKAGTWVTIAAIPGVALLLLFLFGSDFAQMLMHPAFEPLPGFYPQLVLFAVAGFHVLYLAANDWRRNRTPDALLLALWVFGFFVFSTFVNWTINGRTMLPMAPAVGILIARRFDAYSLGRSLDRYRYLVPLTLSTVVALLVLWSDVQLANAGRAAARNFAAERDAYPGNVWIQGNWGARWYFEAAGAKPFDSREPSLRVGDVVVQSSNNLIYPLPNELTQSLHTDAIPAGRFITTMDRRTGAGFYSSVWGSLPYALGPVPDERYHYLRLAPQ